MAISLNKLFVKAEKKYNLKLLAGKKGLENPVRWVHMVEDTEVPDFLHGNELIFTTGIAHQDERYLLDFVKSLKENNSSGLVVNLGPYIKQIPPQVIVYCEQNDFPLFSLPWAIRLIDLTYEFCRIIISDEKVEQSLAEAFKNLIINPENQEGYAVAFKKAGFSEKSTYKVVSVKFLINNLNISKKMLTEIRLSLLKESRLNSLSRGFFIWNKNMVLIYQNIKDEDIKKIKNAICKNTEHINDVEIHIGVSESIDGYTNLLKIYEQSISALKVARLSSKDLVLYKDAGIYKLLFEIKNEELLKDYCNSVLGKLIEYDRESKGDLCKILEEYIENDGSVQKVAEINFIHRNTINYKIKKIKEIMGTGLSIKENADISLAFCILKIIK